MPTIPFNAVLLNVVYPKFKIHPDSYPNLNDQQFRFKKIDQVRDYFIGNTKERELMSKKRNEYIASFDFFAKSLIVLPVTTDRISIASFGPPVGIASANFSLAFSISTGIVK